VFGDAAHVQSSAGRHQMALARAGNLLRGASLRPIGLHLEALGLVWGAQAARRAATNQAPVAARSNAPDSAAEERPRAESQARSWRRGKKQKEQQQQHLIDVM